MSKELFPIESVTMDSPRLRWIKRHGIVTMYFDSDARFGADDAWFAGVAPGVSGKDNIANWFCTETGKNGDSNIGMGSTEDDAISELAQIKGIKLWNEEEIK